MNLNLPMLDAVRNELTQAIVTPAERIAQGSIIGALTGLGTAIVLVSLTGTIQRTRKRPGDLWIWSAALGAPVIGMLFGQYVATRPAPQDSL